MKVSLIAREKMYSFDVNLLIALKKFYFTVKFYFGLC